MKSDSQKTQSQAPTGGVEYTEVLIEDLVPDPTNRAVVEDDEFQGLLDSVRVCGVLEPVRVQRRADGKCDLKGGHRRRRAAELAGVKKIPAVVLPLEADPRRVAEQQIALDQHRRPHGVLEIARRLRRLKNQHAASMEEIAERTGLPAKRVRAYLGLFDGSECLLSFFEDKDIAIYLAVEFLRYEAELGEPAARKLVKQYQERPLSVRDIAALRQRKLAQARATEDAAAPAQAGDRRAGFAARMEAAFQRDAARARAELDQVLARLGLRLAEGTEGAR